MNNTRKIPFADFLKLLKQADKIEISVKNVGTSFVRDWWPIEPSIEGGTAIIFVTGLRDLFAVADSKIDPDITVKDEFKFYTNNEDHRFILYNRITV